MSDWIHDLAVAFARRCRQEAEEMEQWNELQAVPAYCERFVIGDLIAS